MAESGRGESTEAASVAGGRTAALLLVLTGGSALQFGAALATTLFVQIGPTGTVTLRLALAAVVLLIVARPRLRGRSRTDLAAAAGLGVAFAVMNVGIYEAMARMPLGPAVTLEFLGPLGLAVVLSRRLRDVAWVLLAGVASCCSAAVDSTDSTRWACCSPWAPESAGPATSC